MRRGLGRTGGRDVDYHYQSGQRKTGVEVSSKQGKGGLLDNQGGETKGARRGDMRSLKRYLVHEDFGMR